MQIIPSLFTDDQLLFINSLDELQGATNMVQIDIADGVFVDGKTLNDPSLTQQHVKDLKIELHLMVADPEPILEQWKNVSQIKRVYIHIEIKQNISYLLSLISKYGWQVGIAIKPETPISVLEPYIEQIDAVLFLGVEPGGQGRPFNPVVLEKIKTFKEKHPSIFCALDGGVNEITLPEIIKSGVDAICPGSAIFGNERTPAENIERMEKMIK